MGPVNAMIFNEVALIRLETVLQLVLAQICLPRRVDFALPGTIWARHHGLARQLTVSPISFNALAILYAWLLPTTM